MRNDPTIQKILNDKKASRREFLVTASALGLTLTAATTLWHGRAAASTPQQGGHFIAGLSGGSTTDTLNPATLGSTYMVCLNRSFRDNLVDVGQDNKATPALAEGWEATPDAMTWRFKLRPGVEFSNGKSLTAEDVIASINLHRGEQSESVAKSLFDPVENVAADGDTVVFTLSGPNADFPYILTDYHACIVPSKDGVADWQTPAGTGVFSLEGFEPGVRAEVKRNPNAWQLGEFGFFNSAEFLAIGDINARQTAILTGDVHAINRPELKTVGRLVSSPDVDLVDVASNFFYSSPMNTDVEPFADIDFRRAIKYAIDRQNFVDKIAFGYATPGNDQPIGPGFNYHADDIPQISQDLDKAKHYLKKSGFDGASIEYHAADTAYTGAVDAGLLMREDLAKVGIDLNVVRTPNDAYWSDVWNVQPFTACYWGSRPIEDMILSINFVSDAPWNDTRFKNDRLDSLVVTARGELDEQKRSEMYREIQLILSQDGATIVPAYGRDVAVKRSNIGTTGQYGGGWEMDGGHLAKRWWFVS